MRTAIEIDIMQSKIAEIEAELRRVGMELEAVKALQNREVRTAVTGAKIGTAGKTVTAAKAPAKTAGAAKKTAK